MITNVPFVYTPSENEREKASNSYLMSLVALIAGLPLPIINLIATLIFYVSNRKSTYFVRWHCFQALISQASLLIINSICFWWTVRLIVGDMYLTNSYIAYLISVIIFNVLEFIATIYTAIQTRKGKHVEWLFYGSLTNLICKYK